MNVLQINDDEKVLLLLRIDSAATALRTCLVLCNHLQPGLRVRLFREHLPPLEAISGQPFDDSLYNNLLAWAE